MRSDTATKVSGRDFRRHEIFEPTKIRLIQAGKQIATAPLPFLREKLYSWPTAGMICPISMASLDGVSSGAIAS